MRDLTSRRRAAVLLLVLPGLAGVTGCSIRRLAVDSLADALAAGADVYASDDDPDLVRDALPFALKTLESLLAEAPRHPGLLLSACRGFTQYAYAFVQTDAEILEPADRRRAALLRERALRLYLRARDYGLRALDLEHPGIAERLRTDPEGAVLSSGAGEVPLLFWTGAAWGAAISLAKDRPELVADSSAVRALMDRALALDETWDRGALHEVFIVLEALPASMGGSMERAREHFRRAVELSGGSRAGPFVTLAETASVAAQDRAEFESLLARALAVDLDRDPRSRLANRIAQKRAHGLLGRAEELFLEEAR